MWVCCPLLHAGPLLVTNITPHKTSFWGTCWFFKLNFSQNSNIDRLPFLGGVMTEDWVHGVGHSPVCQILLQIVVRVVITSSPSAWPNQFCWDVVNSSWLPFLQWLYCSLHFFAKDGVVILCVCLGTVQYWWISIGLVIVQLSAVICPSVQYLLFFC